MSTYETRGFGWLPPLADPRDKVLAASPLMRLAPEKPLPTEADLREWCSPIEDQGAIGSCTAQAGVALLEYFERRALGHEIHASRLFLYKVSRQLAGLEGDVGCYLRSTMKALALYGVPPESDWPYQEERFDWEIPPHLYPHAQNYKAVEYYRLDPLGTAAAAVLTAIKRAVAGHLPVMFGTAVYSRFPMEPGLPEIPYPGADERVEGGHAMVIVGYDDAHPTNVGKGALLLRNSWGEGWGDKGYGWLPYEYVTRELADDFWTMSRAEYVDSALFE